MWRRLALALAVSIPGIVAVSFLLDELQYVIWSWDAAKFVVPLALLSLSPFAAAFGLQRGWVSGPTAIGLSAGMLGVICIGGGLWLFGVPLFAWAPAALALIAWGVAALRPAWLSRTDATRAILWSALPASLYCAADAFGPPLGLELDVRELVAAVALPAALVAFPRAGSIVLATVSAAFYLWCGLDPWSWTGGTCLMAESATAVFGLPVAVALGSVALGWARPFGRFLLAPPERT